MDGLASDWEILTHGVGAVRRERDIIRVFGADAVSFLQTQITQDVTDLSPGESRWSFILEPRGRVEAFIRIWGRLGDSEILIDVEHGVGHRVIDRLNRFRIRTKVELELFSWDCVCLRGPMSGSVLHEFHSELKADSNWPRVGSGVDLIGPLVEIPEGIPEVHADAFETLRIESGWPDMRHEFSSLLQPAAIPGEVGEVVVASAVSFTKGCYTGQELVVRTHSRGNNTPRRLRRLHIYDGGGRSAPPLGSAIFFADEARGTLTSVAPRPGGGFVGLGFVHRSVEDSAIGTIEWESGELESGEEGVSDRVEVRILEPARTADASTTSIATSPEPVPGPRETRS